MGAQRVVPGLSRIPLGGVNAYLLEASAPVLIDSGTPKRAERIARAAREAGVEPASIANVVITHYHPDHFGSLTEVQRAATGARTHVHALDAAVVRGGGLPPKPTPNNLMGRVIIALNFKPVEAATVDAELADGQELDFAGGARVIHTPGHTPGHVSLLWPEHGGVLIAGDVAANAPTLGVPIADEDAAERARSARKLAELEFDTVVFGHGKPIVGRAHARWRARLEKLAKA